MKPTLSLYLKQDLKLVVSTMATMLEQPASDQPTNHSNGRQKSIHVNWDELGFGLTPTDYMYVMKCSQGESFSQGCLKPYGNIELSPSSGILNYGQGLLEGLKACTGENGEVMLFRPEQNALRMKIGAERMCMPSPSVEQFVDAVKQTVQANMHWVPPPGKGSLYIRPLLMGSGPTLGFGPAPEYTFLIYVSPVGNYHKEHRELNLIVAENMHRAVVGGTGDIKTITNYAPIYKAAGEAKAKSFSDILFLDALTGKHIEELSSCNIFIVKGNVIATPAISGTVLPGITRKSVIEIASDFGYQVEERVVPVEELMDAEEVFCTGTAIVMKPVGSVTYKGNKVVYRTGDGSVSPNLYDRLTGIQMGKIEDNKGWIVKIN